MSLLLPFEDTLANEWLSCNILILLIVGALTLWFRYSNRQADDGKKIIEGSPDFRYTI